jgi:hypothetical protein
MIPEHRHELIRVIVDHDMACLETTIVSPTTHEFAPARVVVARREGKVAAETTWFNWEIAAQIRFDRTGQCRRPSRPRSTT